MSEHPDAKGDLGDYVYLNPSTDLSGLDADALVSFVPMEAVSDDGLGEVSLRVKKLSEVNKGYTSFKDGDILWAKITPCMQNGKAFIAQGLENGFGFGSTEFHVIRPKNEALLTSYVYDFLVQPSLRKMATYTFTGSAGHQRVPDNFLRGLPFPNIGHSEQLRLSTRMSEARIERRAKLAEADELLSNLDEFILDTLGIAMQVPDKRTVFAVSRGSSTSRFDPHFHLPAFVQLISTLRKAGAVRLGSVVTFSNEVWKITDDVPETFRYIEISSVNQKTGEATWQEIPTKEAPSRARMVVHPGDIIISLTRPHHGSIAMLSDAFEGCIASTGFAVIRSVSRNVLREYLWCILRARFSLRQMLQRASGGNYPAITEPELSNILVPVPAMEIQQLVVKEVHRRRDEAQRLRAEAEHGWQSAKRWFEEQLLNPADNDV